MSAKSSTSQDLRQPLLSQNTYDTRNDSHGQRYGTIRPQHSAESLLHATLYPDDVYKGTTYWADLPAKERSTWISHQTRAITHRELVRVRQMFKVNPLKPLKSYWRSYAVSGVGFFIEGYVLFSVGNIMPLFKSVWPECWKNHIVCDGQMIKAIKYLEILGIICGQVIVGYIGDTIGRRWGLIQDAAIMLLGAILLTAMWGASLSGWTIMYGISIFCFAVGVGGEYPMTSTTAMEGKKDKDDRTHRGRSVCLAFLMQGWGQLVNQLALILIMLVFNQTHSLKPPYGEIATQITFRVTFAFAAVCLVYFFYLRIYGRGGARSNERSSGKNRGYDFDALRFCVEHYWHRILATSMCWFCSDFPFYGNQVFRNKLLELVTETSPERGDVLWLYNLINIACELAGYYLAALLVDHKAYGRRRIQLVGFGMMFVLFVIAAGAFPMLNQPGTGARVFQAIFFLSNFWVQFGPNSTTFLVAGEVYPSSVRATAHGFSAAVGKSGALAATVLYNYIEDRTKFWLVSLCTLVGFILTFVFIPDTTGLDLTEQQRYWQQVLEGREEEYHGIAVHPQHLSWFEWAVLKRGRSYDPKLDRDNRIAELRATYAKEQTTEGEYDEQIDDNVRRYFELERACADGQPS